MVAGCTTGCPRTTVVDAGRCRYRVILPRECIGDRTPRIHGTNLFGKNARNGDVVPMAKVEAYFGSMAHSKAA